MRRLFRIFSFCIAFLIIFSCAVAAEGEDIYILGDGLIPVVFTAGYDTDVASHASASGYGCKAVIAAGNSDGIISDGRIVLLPCDTEQYYLYFGSDGTAGDVFSNIRIDLQINDSLYKNAVYGVNLSAPDTEKLIYTDDSHTLVGALPEKHLRVNFKTADRLLAGGILTGWVTEDEGDFSLYASEGTELYTVLAALENGDMLKLSVFESLYEAKEITESGISAFTALGRLIENGKNLTQTTATVGGYNVRIHKASWTILCVLSDGRVMFYSPSEETTLFQAAQTLASMDCKEAYLLCEGNTLLLENSADGISTVTGLAVGAVSRTDTETPPDSPAVGTLGDIDCNGKINTLDLITVKYLVLGIPVQGLTPESRLRGDIDGNGKINGRDYISIRYHILGVKPIDGWE